MNIQILAAEIARRVPEMARDCTTNNAELIAGLLEGLNQERENHLCEELSQVVSDQIDPSVGIEWMRCSPDLPKYVQGLEKEVERLRGLCGEAYRKIVNHHKAGTSMELGGSCKTCSTESGLRLLEDLHSTFKNTHQYQQQLACFNCRDGYTHLYCLNCASEVLKNA